MGYTTYDGTYVDYDDPDDHELVIVRRYGFEGRPEPASHGGVVDGDVYLCDVCADEDAGVVFDPPGTALTDGASYEGRPIFWLSDEAEAGFTACEECGNHHEGAN